MNTNEKGNTSVLIIAGVIVLTIAAVLLYKTVGGYITKDFPSTLVETHAPSSETKKSSGEATNILTLLSAIETEQPSYDFNIINPYIFDYQIDSTTKNVVTGAHIIAPINAGSGQIEREIMDYLLAIGFEENINNAAGPDFGASKSGLEKNNTVCLIETGFFNSDDERFVRVSCGVLTM